MAADRLAGVTILNQRYRLLSELGQGGMARVHKAEDTRLGRSVAVKVLREQYASDRAFLRRFQQEAQAVAALSHPNIVGVYDVGQDGGTYYIVMEYVEGVTLKELIQKQGPLTADVAVGLAEQICAGLQMAHSKGIVHRDVKPQNVIVTPDLRAKIMDFGIARALDAPSVEEANEVFGTVHYISPEQARGQAASPASDIYAMGVMLYEMLTGQLPFPGDNPVDVATRHLREQPRPLFELNPRVPSTLSQIVLDAMAKDPHQRFSSAARLGETLHGYLEFIEGRTGVIRQGKLVASEKESAPPPPRSARRRGVDWLLVMLGILTLVLMLGLGALGATVYRAYQATPTPAPAPTPGLVIVVPNVVRMEFRLAQMFLDAQNLTYKELGREYHETVPLDQVIWQDPEPRTQVQPGGVVGVVISKGPSRVTVPTLKGLTADEAAAQLKALGLSAERADDFDDRVPQGVVFDQEPTSGASVAAGSPIRIKVSKGPRPTATATPRPTPPPPTATPTRNEVSVPNVVGMPLRDATALLRASGLLTFPYPNYQGRDQLPEEVLQSVCVGCVLSTDPPTGTKVARNYEVKLAVRRE